MALRSSPPVALALIATTFTVGTHAVKVSRSAQGRWTSTVDEGPPSSTYDTQVDAWEAGVREADRIDRAGK